MDEIANMVQIDETTTGPGSFGLAVALVDASSRINRVLTVSILGNYIVY